MINKNFQIVYRRLVGKRFYPLFIALVAFIMLAPYLKRHPAAHWHLFLLVAMVLVAVIYSLRKNKSHFIFAIILVIISVSTNLLSILKGSVPLLILDVATSLIFYLFATKVIFSEVMSAKRVSSDTIYGAVCVYFLIGFTFSTLYYLIESIHPGSFLINQEVENQIDIVFELFYFSFITLTTIGYGDITAVTHHVKMFVILEGIIGIFYLAILVSRLVVKMTQDEDSE